MGTIKYLANGQEVSVVQKLKDGYLVACLYGAGEDDYRDDDNVRIVAEVFDAPLTAKFDERISDLRQNIATLEALRESLNKEISVITAREKSRLAKFDQHEQLKQLEDFIDGRLTHFAELPNWGAPKVLTLEDIRDRDYPRKDIKLLTLFGRTNGRLDWKINQYYDGSGSWTTVVPCTSYDDAHSAIKNHILERAADIQYGPREDVIKAAAAFGVALDPEYVAAFKANQEADYRKTIETKEREITQARDAIAALDALTAPTGEAVRP